MAWQPKLQTFLEIVLIFDFMRDEALNFRKTVLGACTRQNKYCRFSPKTTVFRPKMGQNRQPKTALAAKPTIFL